VLLKIFPLIAAIPAVSFFRGLEELHLLQRLLIGLQDGMGDKACGTKSRPRSTSELDTLIMRRWATVIAFCLDIMRSTAGDYGSTVTPLLSNCANSSSPISVCAIKTLH
jgi:hypothetical protein